MGRKFVELEKKIVSEISQELEGRIIVAINKNMAAFSTRMGEKEREIEKATSGINDRLDALKKNVVYEVSKENQKYFAKEAEKLEKKLKLAQQQEDRRGDRNRPALRPASREKEPKAYLEAGPPESHFSEEWALKIREMEGKLNKYEEYVISFDKRYYENMTALKESWKELGEDMLESKRRLAARQDELKLELLKVKGLREFEGAPQDVEESFKNKLLQKFTDIYQLVSNLVTRTDLETEAEKNRKAHARHDHELSDIREELARNTDYFTFYMNNSNEDDLNARLTAIAEELQRKEHGYLERFRKQVERNEILQAEIQRAAEGVGRGEVRCGKLEGEVGRLKEDYERTVERVEVLEDHNKFTPDKMAKIHNTLDIEFTPSEQELLAKKSGSQGQNVAVKELKSEVGKLKDELFVLNHELAEVDKFKKAVAALEARLERMKVESEEAILSRKPWVCLSCDKNEKEKESERLRKDVSKKKLAENRGGLFTENKGGQFSKDKSDKLIKLLPTTEEKFEVYERYREKYLSDSVKLPDIYREKIGEKEPL